ncbi:MAG: tRNA (guanosine(46)-N7)-methyltransferase TrmB [Phycisphaerales bacterium]|nr:tRNA (guanosine(46)-N7)-methyltransferase TrmB [Phycisphaerales bacterium]
MLILFAMRTNSPKNLRRDKKTKPDPVGVLLDNAVTKQPIDLAKIFENDHPLEIEIGVGKGTFLVNRAIARPEVNFLGIEYARAYAVHAADRCRRRGLSNTRMLHTDAGALFKNCIPDKSLWRVHIYFPDPWPKRRHNRRRLIQLPFAREVLRTLKPGGQFIVVTDHMDYFLQVRRVLNSLEGMAAIAMPKMADRDGEIVGTNFERKYIAQGRPFYSTAKMRYV